MAAATNAISMGDIMDDGQTGHPGSRAAAAARRSDPHGVATPDILARLWASDAAEGLARRAPDFSARTGLSISRRSALIIALCLLILTTAGWASWQVSLLTGLAGLLFACLIGLRLLACLLPPAWARRRPLPPCALPRVSVIIALYRERAVLPVLISALEAIDYPADRLEIRLALEADDHETIAAARALELDHKYRIILVPEGGPRTKPRALNYALRFCSGEIVTIHDAEDRPHPRQLRIAAESFAAAGPELACLQAPLNWFNRGECWLTRQFALEYAAHFHALLPLYARLGWPLPLGGTSNHFRTAALRRAGGWDAWNVTEDADLGFRLHALGYRCDVIAPLTLEEAPTRVWPWVCQRTRWLKGYAQTLAVHSRLADLPPRRQNRFALILTLGAALVSALAHAPLAATCLFALCAGTDANGTQLLYGGFLAAGYGTSAATAAVGMRRAGLTVRRADLLLMPLYWPLQSWAAVRALYQLATRPYFWDKTEHGISTFTDPACISPSPPHSSSSAVASQFSCSPAGAPDNRSDPNAARASSPGP
ncbi:Glycosyltransferase, catalytic subunit of cellulose synthase and poly-beta-1,6-N-acetylglucosamine synthase [Maricaulis salignorans]|uniref:Glycosyltransferase, catalytic subunit of cellulose synthase and poly-beta-1,6-N-acetylglucosamine synthase n=2 Tax=Maricaulis salignorans TaxID=144026 RepID=A0A1G9WND3_9PROT|nr:Glycosyltransferase, catalytic subunit of cellulose synthase and poly-beta-1,6-N-acetylglucosamine synthase [Maricaulis salignorans]